MRWVIILLVLSGCCDCPRVKNADCTKEELAYDRERDKRQATEKQLKIANQCIRELEKELKFYKSTKSVLKDNDNGLRD